MMAIFLPQAASPDTICFLDHSLLLSNNFNFGPGNGIKELPTSPIYSWWHLAIIINNTFNIAAARIRLLSVSLTTIFTYFLTVDHGSHEHKWIKYDSQGDSICRANNRWTNWEADKCQNNCSRQWNTTGSTWRKDFPFKHGETIK